MVGKAGKAALPKFLDNLTLSQSDYDQPKIFRDYTPEGYHIK